MYLANQTVTSNGPELNNAVVSSVVTNADLLRAIQALTISISQPKKSSSAKVRVSPTECCWTHGICGHSGTNCKKPTIGHVATATLANPVGGNIAFNQIGNKSSRR